MPRKHSELRHRPSSEFFGTQSTAFAYSFTQTRRQTPTSRRLHTCDASAAAINEYRPSTVRRNTALRKHDNHSDSSHIPRSPGSKRSLRCILHCKVTIPPKSFTVARPTAIQFGKRCKVDVACSKEVASAPRPLSHRGQSASNLPHRRQQTFFFAIAAPHSARQFEEQSLIGASRFVLSGGSSSLGLDSLDLPLFVGRGAATLDESHGVGLVRADVEAEELNKEDEALRQHE